MDRRLTVSGGLLLSFVVSVVILAAAVFLAMRVSDSASTRRREGLVAANKAAAAEQAHVEQVIEAQRQLFIAHTTEALAPEFYRLQARLEPVRARIRAALEQANEITVRAEKPVAWAKTEIAMSASRVVTVTILSCFWILVTALQVYLDYLIIAGLHRSTPLLSLALGLAAVAAVSGVGMGLTVAVRAATDDQKALSRSVRQALVVFGAAFLIVVIGSLVSIAPARSQASSVGDTVTRDEKVVANALDLADGNANDLGVKVAQADLHRARQQLSQAGAIDRVYAVIVPLTDLFLSTYVVSGLELALVGIAASRARRLRAQADALRQHAEEANTQATRIVYEWVAEMSTVLNVNGVGHEQLQGLLFQLLQGGGPGAGPPSPPSMPAVSPEISPPAAPPPVSPTLPDPPLPPRPVPTAPPVGRHPPGSPPIDVPLWPFPQNGSAPGPGPYEFVPPQTPGATETAAQWDETS